MKKIFALLGFVFLSLSAIGGDLSEQDAGIYVILDQKLAPTDIFYRLSKARGKWVVEGKNSNENWTNISCDSSCEYRASTESEIQAHFPPRWMANILASCIQNMAQAFCSYTSKEGQAKGGYVMFALVTGRPIPLFLRRIAP